jgi:hypothetical protein
LTTQPALPTGARASNQRCPPGHRRVLRRRAWGRGAGLHRCRGLRPPPPTLAPVEAERAEVGRLPRAFAYAGGPVHEEGVAAVVADSEAEPGLVAGGLARGAAPEARRPVAARAASRAARERFVSAEIAAAAFCSRGAQGTPWRPGLWGPRRPRRRRGGSAGSSGRGVRRRRALRRMRRRP